MEGRRGGGGGEEGGEGGRGLGIAGHTLNMFTENRGQRHLTIIRDLFVVVFYLSLCTTRLVPTGLKKSKKRRKKTFLCSILLTS